MAPPIDTRLGPGKLELGAPLVDFGAQIANVTLEPSTDEEDGTPTLGDPDPLPEITESWVISGEVVQDFEEAAGFLNFCFDNALSVVAFRFTPNDDVGLRWTGDLLLTSVPIGGDVATQNRSAFEFPVQGTPVREVFVPAAPSGAELEAREARAKRRSSIVARGDGKRTAKAKATTQARKAARSSKRAASSPPSTET